MRYRDPHILKLSFIVMTVKFESNCNYKNGIYYCHLKREYRNTLVKYYRNQKQ